MEQMKARWLKSVVEHSKEAAPALPYHRQVRRDGRHARMFALLRPRKTA
jgi:alkylated DNA nucleotide flippase Atl1